MRFLSVFLLKTIKSMRLEFTGLGSQLFKFIDQVAVGGRHSAFLAEMEIGVDFTFEHCALGDFGEDVPGDRMPMEYVIEISSHSWSNPSRDAKVNGCYDNRARIS